MTQFLEGSDLLELVVEYIGSAPSAFFLRECSRSLYNGLSGVINLNDSDFYDALDRKIVNPKFLKLRVKDISDSVIWKLSTH